MKDKNWEITYQELGSKAFVERLIQYSYYDIIVGRETIEFMRFLISPPLKADLIRECLAKKLFSEITMFGFFQDLILKEKQSEYLPALEYLIDIIPNNTKFKFGDNQLLSKEQIKNYYRISTI